MKKAILFDVDGTLIDTWDFVIGAFKYTLAFYGHPIPSDKVIKSIMGKPLLKFYRAAFPNIMDVTNFAKTHQDYQVGKFDLGKPFPKALQTFKKLKTSGFLLAAISNRTRKSLLTSLEIADFLKHLDLVVSAEDVENPKPHKEHIFAALKQLKVKAQHSYMVGDTPDDIEAGKNAGVKTVGVTYGFFGQSIKEYKPDFVINKIEELLEII